MTLNGEHMFFTYNARAGKCIYYLRELGRSGVLQSDLVHIYLPLVCPVVEDACYVTCGPLGSQRNKARLLSQFKRELLGSFHQEKHVRMHV